MVFITGTVTHLLHKWCVHLILPLTPKSEAALSPHSYMQSIHTAKKHLIDCHNNSNTQCTGLWSSPGFIWQPEEASGVDLTCCCGFCSRSCLVCVVVGGGYFVMSERVRNCSHFTGRYVSQQCQMRTGCSIMPCTFNLLECSG